MGRKKKSLTKEEALTKREEADLRELKKRFKKNPKDFLRNIRKLKNAVDSLYGIELNNVPMDREQHFELKRVENVLEEVSDFLLYEPTDEE